MSIKPKREPRRRAAPQEGRDWWEKATAALRYRSADRCERCRDPLSPDRAERHHRMRRRDGGDRLSNLLWLCRKCHAWITEHPAEAMANGWIVSALASPPLDPATVPVRMGAYGRLHLLDDRGLARIVH